MAVAKVIDLAAFREHVDAAARLEREAGKWDGATAAKLRRFSADLIVRANLLACGANRLDHVSGQSPIRLLDGGDD